MAAALVMFIRFVQQALILLVIVYAVLTFVMAPYHPVRTALARIIEPLLRPIQRIVPPMGGVDLSPLVLIILVQLFGMILSAVIINFFG
jgi:YggT family protein